MTNYKLARPGVLAVALLSAFALSQGASAAVVIPPPVVFVDDFAVLDGASTNLEYAQYGLNRDVGSSVIANLSPWTSGQATEVSPRYEIGLENRILWTRTIGTTIPDSKSSGSAVALNDALLETPFMVRDEEGTTDMKYFNSLQFNLKGRGSSCDLSYWNYRSRFNGAVIGQASADFTPNFGSYPAVYDSTTSYATTEGLDSELSKRYLTFYVSDWSVKDPKREVASNLVPSHATTISFTAVMSGGGRASFSTAFRGVQGQWYAIPLNKFSRFVGSDINSIYNIKHWAGTPVANARYSNAEFIYRWDLTHHLNFRVTNNLVNNANNRAQDWRLLMSVAGMSFRGELDLPAGTVKL